MKRLWLILPAAIMLTAILLTGCKKEQPQVSTEPSAPEEESKGLIVKDSAVEQQTGGAVSVYTLPKDTYFDLAGMGNHLLTLGRNGLTLLTGEKGEVLATLPTTEITPLTVMDTAVTGLAYYLPSVRQVVVLNPQLQMGTQMEMPENIVGNPVISLVRNEVFYSTGNELRGLNLNTGISRLIRQQTAGTQTLLGVYFNGTVLLCQMTNGTETVMTYISSETGQTLGNAQKVSNLQTYGENFYANWMDGTVRQSVFGTRQDTYSCFLAPRPGEDTAGGRQSVLEMNGIVDYVKTAGGIEFSFYDLDTGRCTSRVMVPNMMMPTQLCCDGSRIWILTADEQNSLYSWDITKSPVEGGEDYTGPLYTLDNPDTEGLAQCRDQADDYEVKYGVKILLWRDAVKYSEGHTLEIEHNPQVIDGMLEQMISVLEKFPEKFLLKTVEAGWIRIALVQSIDGGQDWVQFWKEGDCYVVISSHGDVVQSLIRGISYGIDSHVLGNSRDYDTWDEMNPKGFAYAYDGELKERPAYLEGNTRAFTDTLSMRYPLEDRCSIFYNAMLPDNQEMFTSPIMKEKLLRVCTGIRESYNLEKSTDTYPWEQYLGTSLAYVEK